MRSPYVFVLLSLYSLNAFALPSLNDSTYYSWKDLPRKYQVSVVGKASQATIGILLPTHKHYFSGTIVSNDGIVIGALHTLANCHGVNSKLFLTRVIRDDCKKPDYDYPDLGSLFLRNPVSRIPENILANVEFADVLLREQSVSGKDLEEAKVIFMGSGMRITADQSSKMSEEATSCVEKAEEVLDQTNNDDFIVFKLPNRKGGYPCAILRKTPESEGIPIWQVGYPNDREGITSSKSFSVGSVVVPHIQSYMEGTAYASPGMSGGSVFNQNGELIGVISGMGDVGYTRSVNSQHIWRETTLFLGEKRTTELFRCNITALDATE